MYQQATKRLQRDEQKSDVAIGQVDRLDVVPRAVGELPQACAVHADLVEMIVLGYRPRR